MKSKRTQFELLKQWLQDNPKVATEIATQAIWGLHSTKNGKLEDPEEENPVSGGDYIDFMLGIFSEGWIPQVLDSIRSKKRDKLIPEVTHWIVSGRIPGDDDDSALYVCVPKDSTPTEEFILEMYNGPPAKGWRKREPTPSENAWGTWAYINQEIEIHGPPVT